MHICALHVLQLTGDLYRLDFGGTTTTHPRCTTVAYMDAVSKQVMYMDAYRTRKHFGCN